MFANLNLHFDTAHELAQWLATQPRPAWKPVGSTYHNTWKPNADQWAGHASMKNMQAGYEKLGWDRGPHVYLAHGTRADGIFVMTPPQLPGIHSPSCNGSTKKPGRYGIEVVGDFQATPMSAAQLDLLVSVTAALHRYARLPADINAHRDCDPRTCPGDAAYAQKPAIQRALAAALSPRYTPDSPLLAPSGATLAQLLRSVAPGEQYGKAAIVEIMTAYAATCTALGVDAAIAVAQMLHETGNLTSWWAARPRRNPAGIGVTGHTRSEPPLTPELWAYDAPAKLWRYGLSFTSWALKSVPAHVGRLLAYALPAGGGNALQRAAIDAALTVRPLPPSLRGAAPTLQGLEDTWATDGDPTTESFYAEQLAQRANRIAAL